MIFISTLRIIIDLSFYFFFANLIIGVSGGDSIMVTVGVLLPPIAYIIYLVLAKKLETSWERQADLFSLSWKTFLISGICICLVGKYEAFFNYSVPMAIISLFASVLLLRMLRHSPEVYLSKQYQAKNILLLSGMLAAAWILSSEFVLKGILNTCSFIYRSILLPILTFFITCMTAVIGLILKLFSWMNLIEIDLNETDVSPSEGVNPFSDLAENPITGSQSIETILTIIGVIILIIAAFFFFRRLASSEKAEHVKLPGISIVKSKTSDSNREYSTSTVHQVRRQYRKFLKLYRFHGERILASDTSANIAQKGGEIFLTPDMMDEIREIYIRARYNNQATRADLRKIKQINHLLFSQKNEF